LLRRTVVGIGTKRHFAAAQQTVAIGGKADITLGQPQCPLMTRAGVTTLRLA